MAGELTFSKEGLLGNIFSKFSARKPSVNPSEGLPGSKVEKTVVDVRDDQEAIHHYFAYVHQPPMPDVRPVAADSFLEKSKNSYSSQWMAREIVQNFVDHNPLARGTLDGVRFLEEEAGEGKRFRVVGNWPFEDLTPILTLCSDKEAGFESAGGNGLAIKQIATRLLRDYGASFEIRGEDWTVVYRRVTADEVNQSWEASKFVCPAYKMKRGWILAEVKRGTGNKGSCEYVIETKDPALVRVFSEMKNLGVSKSNPFLQNPDYESSQGSIKWLPRKTGEESLPKGRIFLNGQVMAYKENGGGEEYWNGPEGVTLRLNNVRYAMTLDRFPLGGYELQSYSKSLIKSLTPAELLRQLQLSSDIWLREVDSENIYDSRRQGAFVFIEAIVERLKQCPGYSPDDFKDNFPGDKLLATEYNLSQEDNKFLIEQGYILCPSYFADIGMPKAGTKLPKAEVIPTIFGDETKKPKRGLKDQEVQSEMSGILVGYETLEAESPEEYFRTVRKRLLQDKSDFIEIENQPGVFRIEFKGNITKEMLTRALYNPKTDDQRLLSLARGIVFFGLSNQIFDTDSVFSSQQEYLTTYDLEYDKVEGDNFLISRNNKHEGETGFFLQFKLNSETTELLRRVMKEKIEPDAISAQVINGEQTVPDYDQDTEGENVEEVFRNIPITQPSVSENLNHPRTVIKKKIELPPEEASKMAKVAERIPAIRQAVDALEAVAPSLYRDKKPINPAFGQYVNWRTSDTFYGQLGDNAGYLTGRHLLEIFVEHDQADITVVEIEKREQSNEHDEIDTLNRRLKRIVNRLSPEDDKVDEFAIVLEPVERELVQLGLLRAFHYLTTDTVMPNDLFIFEGTGTRGVNLATKAIGLHRALFKTSFKEAMQTYSHEIVHNVKEDHDADFARLHAVLLMEMEDRTLMIAEKLKRGDLLTKDEEAVLDIYVQWESLRMM